MTSTSFGLLFLTLFVGQPIEKKADEPKANPVAGKPHPMAGLRLRSLGPGLMSGRIVGFAVDPRNRAHYYVAVASGGVWKTTNAGVTWTPVFDNEGSYSIGCVTLDPKDPNVVWVGTGENNSQRSVGYGDGVYKSIDGGRSWRNVGLKGSEHIAKIVVDPRDSDTVYVAAQGPLWGPGGDRGLYRTTDGGKSWAKLLDISENTGVNDLVQDPRNPDVMVASAYQRRRHVYTIVNGGPESAIHRTTDGGKTWSKVRAGLPTGDLGRIGLAMAPTDPDTIYATVEAAEKQGGLFRSTDRGVTWEKRNPFDEQGQYYAHAVVDPVNKDRVYVMNLRIQVSDDGGRTLTSLSERWKHVDNHEIWIDPSQPDYYLVGCDGGIYESFDRGANWRHVPNLPVTQFYDVTVEQTDTPFYRVYGGTQDNNTLGGPARTMSGHGITNPDWHVIVGGDGFQTQVDPKDPNVVYAEFQYGGLVRFDWRTGQRVPIQPKPGPGEPPLRWNWDSPLLISPHKNTRLYYCANRVFRSDDRGDSWTAVSGDLSRRLDRDKLPVFGKVQPPEAVFKHGSTSPYGNITAFAESPKAEGRLYAGTDDGLIQTTADGGKTWSKVDKFPGVPDSTYVARVIASQHDANTVYAAFDNHKSADFAPYLLRSPDAGKTWTAIVGDLPARGSVLAFAEDHVNPKLLFCGTEFGLYFTVDGGGKWHRLRSGLPTVAVKDLAVQRAMNDLVVGTFGRGFYVLDDYSPLRQATAETLEKPATIFPVRDGFQYPLRDQYGGRGKASLGETFYTTENPAYGASIAYHLKESLPTRKARRKEAAKGPNPAYPSLDELRAEAEAEEPAILLTIADADGTPLRVLTGPAAAGVHRVTWDLRLPGASLGGPAPTRREADEDAPSFVSSGPQVVPGKYQVSLARRVDGKVTALAGPVEFTVKYVGPQPLAEDTRKALAEFQKQVIRLQRDLNATLGLAGELTTRLDQIKAALDQTPAAPAAAREKVRQLIARHRETVRRLAGDPFLSSRWENAPMSIRERVGVAADATRSLTDPPTGTQREQFKIAREELNREVGKVQTMVEKDVKELEQLLDKLGAPWTPGRFPVAEFDGRALYQKYVKSTVFICTPLGRGHGEGSGSLIDAEKRYVITTSHVVDDAPFVYVQFPVFLKDGTMMTDRKKYIDRIPAGLAVKGKVLHRDTGRGLALIQLDRLSTGTEAIPLAEQSVKVGETLLAIGNPEKMDSNFSTIRTEVRWVGLEDLQIGDGSRFKCRMLTLTNPIGSSDRGGPMIDRHGHLVAVTGGPIAAAAAQNVIVAIDVTEIRAFLAEKKMTIKGLGGEPDVGPDLRPPRTLPRNPFGDLRPRTPVKANDRPPAEAPVPPPVPATTVGEEEQAAKLLQRAKLFANDDDNRALYKARLMDVVKTYPGTSAASDAKKLLERLK